MACEFSGRVRDAFIAAGHDAVSCDLLPSETPGPHIIGDARGHLGDGWDLLVGHPPCTNLANSGVRWLYGGKGTKPDRVRWREMEDAAEFFADLLTADVPHVAIENPIMHGFGKDAILSRAGERWPDRIQTVQPYQYGTPETKATQLWLRGLPPLVPTNIVAGRTPRVHFASPGPNRWKERSRTDPNIAAAMADQWGRL